MMIASAFDTTSKQTSGQTNRMTYFPRFAFNISKVIFFAYSFFLRVCLLYVLFVCLTFFFLLLFSNKMKGLFLFYRGTVLSHTAKYRMNDVTMIYRIVL